MVNLQVGDYVPRVSYKSNAGVSAQMLKRHGEATAIRTEILRGAYRNLREYRGDNVTRKGSVR